MSTFNLNASGSVVLFIKLLNSQCRVIICTTKISSSGPSQSFTHRHPPPKKKSHSTGTHPNDRTDCWTYLNTARKKKHLGSWQLEMLPHWTQIPLAASLLPAVCAAALFCLPLGVFQSRASCLAWLAETVFVSSFLLPPLLCFCCGWVGYEVKSFSYLSV